MEAGEREGEREGGGSTPASYAVTAEDIADAYRGRGGAVVPQYGVGGAGGRVFSFVCLIGQSKHAPRLFPLE